MIYRLPLFPLRTVLFPGQALPLHIFEPRYRQMIADCLETDRVFGVALIQEGAEVGGPVVPYSVGTTAMIQDVEHLPDGRMNLLTVGRERFRIQDLDADAEPYLIGYVVPWPWDDSSPPETALSARVRRRLQQYVDLLARASETDVALDQLPQHPSVLAALAAVVLQIPAEQKQTLLETSSVSDLFHQLDRLLHSESRGLQIMLSSCPDPGKMDGPFSQN
jgi:Lon protease-like protein